MRDEAFDWYVDNLATPNGPLPGLTAAEHRQLEWDRAVAGLDSDDPRLGAVIALARTQGLVVSPAQARSSGLTSADLRRFLRRGEWTAPRRNVLSVLPRPRPDSTGPHGLSPEILATAVVLARPGTVISHESAATIDALPLLKPPSRPQVTVGHGNGGGERDVLVHAAALTRDETTTWFGVAVTKTARTVVDVARGAGVRSGLVAADAALHDGLASPDELMAAVARAHHWPGITAARRAVDFASPLAESPLESLIRLLIDDRGVAVPQLQVWVRTARATYRVDGLWAERGVVLEADGMLKYQTPAALRREKLRQEDLERAGYRVVRVTWEDVRDRPAQTVWRIIQALRLGGRRCSGVG